MLEQVCGGETMYSAILYHDVVTNVLGQASSGKILLSGNEKFRKKHVSTDGSWKDV
jgi:hypothetical protein